MIGTNLIVQKYGNLIYHEELREQERLCPRLGISDGQNRDARKADRLFTRCIHSGSPPNTPAPRVFPFASIRDSLDWKKLSKDEMVSRVMSRTKEGSILLFHNDVANTPAAVDEILKQLSEKGFTFVTVSDLIYKDNYQLDPAGKQIPKAAQDDTNAA